MFKNLVKVAAMAAVLSFAGIATAGPISASSSTTAAAKAQAKAVKASAKAAKKALKAYNKCMKRAKKGKVSAASCGGSKASYSLGAPTVTAQASVSTSGPSCTTECAKTVADEGQKTSLAAEVPEPTTLALIGASLLGMGFAARRRKLKAQTQA